MHANPVIDDTLSGTTAIAILFVGDTMYTVNIGDSRAIAVERLEDGTLNPVPLSDDQTPYRKVWVHGWIDWEIDRYMDR